MNNNYIDVDQKLPILKTIPLSLQHLFAMFASTIVIPLLFNINPATVLLFNGIGTLVYLVICKGKIPAYLGSSMAFISPVFLIMSKYNYNTALSGFFVIGLVLCLIGIIIKYLGTKWLDVLFPPATMGAIVIVIGLELLPMAANMAGFTADVIDIKVITVSITTLLIAIFSTIVFKGFISVISILVSIVFGYIVALCCGIVDLSIVNEARFVSLPTIYKPQFNMDAIILLLPVSLVVIAEHIGHFIVIGNIINKDIVKDPGLSRSIFGNGLSTIISSLFGSTPNTTYGENIGVLAITKVFSTWVLGGAAVIAIILSFFGKFAAIIQTIPKAVMGGISILLFGVIAVSGIRILIDKQVNYNNPKNLILTSIVLGIGISGTSITLGTLTLKGMSLATIIAVLLNIVLYVIESLQKYFHK